MNPIYIYLSISLVIFLFLLISHNRFSRSRTALREALEGVDLQWTRRDALVAEMEALLRGADVQTDELLDQLAAQSAPAPGQAGQSDPGPVIQRVLLHAGETARFRDNPALEALVRSHERTDSELHMAMRYYNALAREHNTLRSNFPTGIAAMLLGVKSAPYYDD